MRLKFDKFILSAAVALAMLGGCASSKDAQGAVNLLDQGANAAASHDMPEESMDENLGHISYLKFDVDQNANALPMLPFEAQSSGETLLQKRFNALDLKAPLATAKDAFWGLEYYKNTAKRQYYFSNMRKIPNEWFEKVRKNASMDSFGLVSLPAITTANASLRNLPTDEAVLYNPVRAGEGLPFDYAQLSFISIGYPLYVSHFSADGAWAFVGSDNVWAWVKSTEIKILSANAVQELKNSKFLSVIKDEEPVYDKNGNFLFYGRIGAILPFQSEDRFKFYGKIQTQSGLKKYEISKQSASRFPLKFSDENVRALASSLLGQSYGWGGFGGKRDCSLFLQDFLGSFGVWLPRNSKAQGQIGKVVSLANLSAEEKLHVIKTQAVPYRTLFHMNGHIMLYAGLRGGEPLAVHDVWGIRTKDNGRAMIGGVAITTLKIGSDVADIDPKRLLVSRINSMNTFEVTSGEEAVRAKKSAIEKAYGVKIVGNEVVFADGSKVIFDDGEAKDTAHLLNLADVEDTFAQPYPLFKPLALPVNDAGRYRNYELLDKIYGASEAEVKANLTGVVWLKTHGGKTFKFNSKNGAAAALQAVSNELDALVAQKPELLKFLDNPSGTFNWRVIAGTKRKSAHSYGIAIDINTDKSDYWRWSKDGSYRNQIPEEIVRVFEKHGFIWGGRWVSFDTMHFEYRPEFGHLK